MHYCWPLLFHLLRSPNKLDNGKEITQIQQCWVTVCLFVILFETNMQQWQLLLTSYPLSFFVYVNANFDVPEK